MRGNAIEKGDDEHSDGEVEDSGAIGFCPPLSVHSGFEDISIQVHTHISTCLAMLFVNCCGLYVYIFICINVCVFVCTFICVCSLSALCVLCVHLCLCVSVSRGLSGTEDYTGCCIEQKEYLAITDTHIMQKQHRCWHAGSRP